MRDLVEAGVLSLEHVATECNVADIGTKALGRIKFLHLCELAMGRGDLERPSKRQRTEHSDEFS